MAVILSIFPFLLFLVLLLVRKATLLETAVLTLFSTFCLVLFYWQIKADYLLLSFGKGFGVAWDIFLIITGALFFLSILRHLNIINNVSLYLKSISGDYRVQVIMLAWFLESFIEGTAGFGTPAMIVAPLLIAIGLSPITAVVVALLGNSAAVVFGAAGTPIRVGLAGLVTPSLPFLAAVINCVGFIVPIFMLMTIVSNQKNKGRQFLEALPFAIISGLAFVIPSVFFVFLGQEFPSILGSITGLGLTIVALRLGLGPGVTRTMTIEVPKIKKLLLVKTFLPYVILIGLLVLEKYFLGLVNPGLAFTAAGIISLVIFGRGKLFFLQAIVLAARKAVEPFLVILSMSVMTQLMINSGNNFSGVASQLEIVARFFETPFLPMMAPIVGAFGAFLTGSATVSNLMFGNLMNAAAVVIGIGSGTILALQLVGASAGNMIALSDILAAETVAGLKNQERNVLAGVIIPCAIYVFLVGLIGMIIVGVW